jgi:hypothetical protein
MDNNQIIKHIGNGLIQKVGNAISVTNKLFATTEPQLIPYRKKDKWGFCTPDKKIVIDCVYDEAFQFFEGLVKVKLNGKYGFIDKKSKVIIPIEYEKASNFKNGEAYTAVNRNGKSSYVSKDNIYREGSEYAGQFSGKLPKPIARMQMQLLQP